MKKLLDFLRLRKQYDSIKFALILFVCAVFSLTSGIIQIVSYASYLDKPCEYILEAYSDSASLEIALQKICDTEGAVCASFQYDYIITTGDNKTLMVSELTQEYLWVCYGIEAETNSNKVWLNSVAFDEFIGDSESGSVRLSYIVDGKTETAEFIRWESLDSENAYAVSIGTTASLGNSHTVRVMFDNIDITGTNIRQIENLGYSISNREDMLLQSHEQEMLLLETKCCIFATLLSLVGGLAFVEIYNCKKRLWYSQESCCLHAKFCLVYGVNTVISIIYYFNIV